MLYNKYKQKRKVTKMKYEIKNSKNLEAYRQTAGTIRLDFWGHGKIYGRDQMSPMLSYWDSLGRQVIYSAYDVYSLLKKVDAQTLKSENITTLKCGRKCSIELAKKVAEKLNLKLK